MIWHPLRRRLSRQLAAMIGSSVRSAGEGRRILGDNPWGLRRSRWHRLRASLSSLIAP